MIVVVSGSYGTWNEAIHLNTFVRENGTIKYLECMCRVLRVGVGNWKCCKGRADLESRPSLRFFSDCQPRSDRWYVIEPGSKL